MQLKASILISPLLLFIGLIAHPVFAQDDEISIGPASQFLYYSETELTRLNERLPFDLAAGVRNPFVNGKVLTADQLILNMEGPVFYDTVLVSHCDLAPYDSLFDAPYFQNLPNTFIEPPNALISAAGGGGTYFSNVGGNYQSRLQGSNGGCFLQQWRTGIPYDSTRIDNSRNIPYGNNVAIYFEGDLQLAASMGTHPSGFGGINGVVNGSCTIGCSGNLEIWDNVIYSSYSAYTIPDSFPLNYADKLGLVSEQNIIIKDVDPNGRGNGLNQPGGHSRKHIVITAALLAYGSFTFEHQNNDGDGYVWCDPDGEHAGETDERGSIWLRGSLAQGRRGYLHNDNCEGTGYQKDFSYDQRFRTTSPPHFPEIMAENTIFGDFRGETVHIYGATHVWPGKRLELGAGTTLRFHRLGMELGKLVLDGSDLLINGTERNPVRIFANFTSASPIPLIEDKTTGQDDGIQADSSWDFLEVTGYSYALPQPDYIRNSKFHVTGDSGVCSFYRPDVDLDHKSISECWFEGAFAFDERGHFPVSMDFRRNVVEGRIDLGIPENTFYANVTNCTFRAFENDYDQPAITGADNIRNSFFHGAYSSIEADLIEYSGTYNVLSENPFVGNTGEGLLIDVDPLFEDAQRHNYRLQEDSPLINAGSPNSPLDPDNTRADIGALIYDGPHNPVQHPPTEKIPEKFSITEPYPNPFNSKTKITVSLPQSANLNLMIYNTLGQNVAVLTSGSHPAGIHNFTLESSTLSSGIYFIHASVTRNIDETIKVVLIR
ncbi:MAG: T9SS type A sorting domain-containing protein [Candidatus Electryonea clarkiae]|nr:T9SS type A sorting domain-containing protein [Candidatus Electryonea clarkiae]MDP8285326.1 T9SS type A sorting domain-containing protein [Candidatus Electryonea clarkiae]